jgi:uncharacterized coiled-coil DUF342 family protein
MESMRATWTDERLDDLIQHMDDGFERVDNGARELRREMRQEFASVRAEMKGEFASVRAEMKEEFASVRSEMREGFASVRGDANQQVGALREEMQAMGSEINARFDSMQRTMIQFGGSLIVAFAGLIIAVVLRG